MLPEPPIGYLFEEEADPALRGFVTAGPFDAPQPLPKRAHPDQAGEFVNKFLSGDKVSSLHMERCGQLARFFALRDAAGPAAQWIGRLEQDDETFRRTMAAVALASDLGGGEPKQQAVNGYRRLVSHPQASKQYGQLASLLFHLPPEAEDKVIAAPIKQSMQKLKNMIEQDDDAAVEFYRLENLHDDRLATVQKARQRRLEIEAMEDEHKRLLEVIQFYLELQRFAYVDMRAWATMRLQLHCRETEPAVLASAFTRALEMIRSRAEARGDLNEKDAKDLNKYVTRCVRAVRFYRGSPPDLLVRFAGAHRNDQQVDVLHWHEDAPAEHQPGTPPKPTPDVD